LTEQAVLHEVGEYLPLSMLPDELFVVPQLPMSSNGKVDRARLLADAGRKKA
jgi:acyl-CoA synthetase (AMP-forming)/AMP-acid ligase II